MTENNGFVDSSSDLGKCVKRSEGNRAGNADSSENVTVQICVAAEDLFPVYSANSKWRGFVLSARNRFRPTRLMPILEWLPRYHLSYIKSDLIGAITVAIMHVPQGLAYGELAGVSAIEGLYVSVFPALVYALLGTTRHVSIGTFAIVALLVRGAISEISEATVFDYHGNETLVAELFTRTQLTTTLSAVVGVIQLLMGLLSLGSFAVLLSEPMVSGFTTGAAVHVVASQLRTLFDIHLLRRSGPSKALLSFYDVFTHISELNWVTTAVSFSAMFFIYQGQQINKCFKDKLFMPVPMELLTVIIATAVSYFAGLKQNFGTVIMGPVPTGMPPTSVPEMSLFGLMLKHAFIIAFISYVIVLSLGKTFGRRNGYEVDANQELIALGGANIMGSFVNCFPCGASLSRSSLQEKAGGETQLTSIFSSILLLFVILFGGPLFFYLPKCVLSSIVIVALKGMLFQVRDCVRYFKVSYTESGVWLCTFLAVFLLDIGYGVAVGVFAAVATLLLRATNPSLRVMSRVSRNQHESNSRRPEANENVDNRPISAEANQGFRLVRIESEVNFLNRDSLKQQLLRETDAEEGDTSNSVIRLVILDFTSCPFVDVSGCATLSEVIALYTERGIRVGLIGINDNVISFLGLSDSPNVAIRASLKNAYFEISDLDNFCHRL